MNTLARRTVLCAGLSISACSLAAELPVTSVTLYRSGVAALEHRGSITDSGDVSLRFTTEQLNDVLKSIVAYDAGGGRVDALSFEPSEPLDRRLADFLVDLRDNPSTHTILARLRGASVRLETPEGPVTGSIVGVETSPTVIGDTVVELPKVSVLTDSGVRTVALSSVNAFSILDERLAEDLRRALAAIGDNRTGNSSSVDVAFSGDGARTIGVVYTHAAPVWKTSYRLVLPDETGASPTLHGWAIIENATEQDWSGVNLSLASGQPVSFVMDLQTPIEAYRPVVDFPLQLALAPTQYEGGVAANDAAGKQFERTTAMRAAPQAEMDATFSRAVAPSDRLESSYAAQSQATAGEIGEQFFYTLDAPVSLDRGRSAMLPILSAPIEGRRVTIYSPARGQTTPMRGVQITNNTDLELLAGPLAVYDGDQYAGDAQIGHVARDDERLLAYAVDQAVRIQDERSSDNRINKLTIIDGMLIRESTSVRSHAYTLRNTDDRRGRTVILETDRMQGWTLVSDRKPFERTDDLLRFEIRLDPGETIELPIRFERVDRQSLAITDVSLDSLAVYQTNGVVSQQVVDAIRKAADMRSSIESIRRESSSLTSEQAEIFRDQERLRQNMQTVDRNTDLYARYAQRLAQQEDRLESIRARLTTLETDRLRAEQKLRDYLRSLNLN